MPDPQSRPRTASSLPLCLLFAAALATATQGSSSQTARNAQHPVPTLVLHDGRYALMVDGAPYLMLGAQVHNSSAWPAMMPSVWQTMDELHVNTLEAPVYWEEMEPRPGEYNFAQADMLIDQSRQHGVRLVLLWFGTWKNGSGHYTPQWIKQDLAKYPHVLTKAGVPVDSLSPHAPATLAADKRAFAALMRHLRSKDPQRTVIMVQVENEAGTWGAIRDYSPTAEALFQQSVPENVLRSMGKQQPGTWQEVFGDEAGGFFHTWAVATYINQVAAAGKAEYPLPMYVNAALRDPLNPGKQGSWESGGPTDDVLAIWKAAAPAIDVLAPDIYLTGHARYSKLLDLYGTPTNALMVPETGNRPEFARFCFATVGHGGIGWAPFGVDRAGRPSNRTANGAGGEGSSDEQLKYDFEVLRPADRLIARLNFEGRVKGSAEDETLHSEQLPFGAWAANVSYGQPSFGMGNGARGNDPVRGEALIAQLAPNEFLVAAFAARVDFDPAGGSSKLHRQFLAVEEGTYVKGQWVRSRILNGDETDYGLNFTTDARLLKVTLATY